MTPEAPAAQCNPFAFPPDTDSRFALLVVSVVGVGLQLYSLIFESLPATAEYRGVQYASCLAQSHPDSLTSNLADNLARLATFSECTVSVDRIQAVAMLGGALVLLAVATAIYWTAPRRKIWRQRLQALTAEDAPEVLDCLAELSKQSGVSKVPLFVWDPLDSTVSGSAFGRVGRYQVALTGGLVSQFYTDQPLFRAVLLHELAHLRNADVDRTYFALAVWQSFLATAVLPFGLSLIVSGRSPADVVSVAWRVIPLAVLVYLMRNAVLRTREVYADVRAALWDGPNGALRRTVQMLGAPAATPWRRLLSVHPDPAARRQTLDDVSPLFRLRLWDAFAAGFAAGIAFLNIDALLELLVPFPWTLLRPLITAVVIAPLLVTVVGLDIWRGTLVALVRGEAVLRLGRLAGAVGLGFVFGLIVSFGVAFPPGYVGTQAALTGVPLVMMTAVWGLVLVGVLSVFFRWIAAGASSWLELAARYQSPRPAYWFGLIVASGLLVAWLAVLVVPYIAIRWTGGLLASPAGQSLTDAIKQVPATTAASPPSLPTYLVPMTIGLWFMPPLTLLVASAFPLAPWLWRERVASGSTSSWMSLDARSAVVVVPGQAPLRTGFAVVVGVLGGLASCVLSFLVWASLFSNAGSRLLATFGRTSPSPDSELPLWFGSELILAVLIQLIVATWVLKSVRRLDRLHVLFATSVAASIMVGLGGPLFFSTQQPIATGLPDWVLLVAELSLPASAISLFASLTVFAARRVLVRPQTARGHSGDL